MHTRESLSPHIGHSATHGWQIPRRVLTYWSSLQTSSSSPSVYFKWEHQPLCRFGHSHAPALSCHFTSLHTAQNHIAWLEPSPLPALPRNLLSGRETCSSIFNLIFFAAPALHKPTSARWELKGGEMKQQDLFQPERDLGWFFFFPCRPSKPHPLPRQKSAEHLGSARHHQYVNNSPGYGKGSTMSVSHRQQQQLNLSKKHPTRLASLTCP